MSDFHLRLRNWGVILYNDNEEHIELLEKLKQVIPDYLYILHDQDYDDKGEIKKAHYHFVMRFANVRMLKGVAREYGIPENMIYPINDLDSGLLYLIHYGTDKHKYDINETVGTLKYKLEKLAKFGVNEGDKVVKLLDVINSSKYIYITDFAKWCALNGVWDVYRRGASIFNKIIDEHNQIYNKDLQSRLKGL